MILVIGEVGLLTLPMQCRGRVAGRFASILADSSNTRCMSRSRLRMRYSNFCRYKSLDAPVMLLASSSCSPWEKHGWPLVVLLTLHRRHAVVLLVGLPGSPSSSRRQSHGSSSEHRRNKQLGLLSSSLLES